MVINIAKDLQDTQDQLGPSDTQNLVFKLFNQQAPTVKGTQQTIQQNIGHAFTVGHATNGIIGTANGVDGSQVTIGTGGLGSSSIVRISSNSNTFIEPLRDTTYIDTDETSATVDTNNYRIDF